MPTIKNKLKRTVYYELSPNKSIAILPEDTATVDAKDLESPIVKRSLGNGDIILFGEGRKVKKESNVSTKDKQPL